MFCKQPQQSFRYQFPLKQSGTYWYHSHSGWQEQLGMYGALIIEPAEGDPIKADREHVLILSDWTDQNPADLLRYLKSELRLMATTILFCRKATP